MPKVLIVDDDFTIRRQLEEMLAALQYEVVGQAASGKEGVEMARERRPDIVLMDVGMPGDLNGIQAARIIGEQWDIPIIFLSGDEESGDTQETKFLEPFGCILKPFNKREVRAFAEFTLFKHKMEKRLKDAQKGIERSNRQILREIKDRQEKQRFKELLLENSPNLIVVIGIDSTIQYVNPAFEGLLGFSSIEAVGAKAPYPWWPTDFPPFGGRNDFLETIFSGPQKAERRFQTKSGEIVWVECNSIPVYEDDEPIYALYNGTDITHRKKVEETLLEGEERLRAITDNALDAIFCKDIHCRYTFVNPSMVQLLGCTEADLIGKHPEDVFKKQDASVVQEVDARTLQGETVNEIRSLSIAGKTRTFHTIQTPLQDSHGAVTGMSGIVREVTEQIQMQEALRKSKERYRFLVENSSDIIWSFDLQAMNFTYFSHSAEKILGFPQGKDRVATLDDIFSPATKKKVLSAFGEALKNDSASSQVFLEVEVIRKDGETVVMEINAGLHRDQWHQPVCFTGVSRDITDRRRMEKALREQENYLRAFIDATKDGFWIIDEEGRISDPNDAYCRMSGYSRKELSQLRIPDLDIDEDPKETAARIRRIVKNGSELFQTRHRRKDGSFWDVEVSAACIQEGIPRFVGFCRDITQRKQMERKLRESEQKLAAIFDTAYSGIFLVDAEGTITFANRRMAEMLGFRMEELVGSYYPDLVQPCESRKTEMKMFQIIRGEIDCVFLERPYRKKDGTLFWGEISGNRLCRSDGAFWSLVGVITDITEKKRLEDLLQQARRMESIGTLTGGIAHDYNNLLAIILGNLSLMKDMVPSHSITAGFLREMEKASKKARDLTCQLMRLAPGAYLAREEGAIENLLRETAKEIPANAGIECRFLIQDDLWPSKYDAKSIRYAIDNICENALEAMPLGGTITFQVNNQAVENKDTDYGTPLMERRYVRISIQDEGRGISKAHLEKIFDPYYTTKERGSRKGTGLGLSLAHTIVQKHGGYLLVDSIADTGTNVAIFLPVVEEER